MPTLDPGVIQALQAIDAATMDRRLDDLRKESDRGAVLVAIAMIDDILGTRLRAVLAEGTPSALERLFAPPTGALSGVSSKLDMAFCLGLINRMVHADARLINKLRNRCAHDWESFQFTDAIVDRYIRPTVTFRALDAADRAAPARRLLKAGATPRKHFDIVIAGFITLVNVMLPFPSRETTGGAGA